MTDDNIIPVGDSHFSRERTTLDVDFFCEKFKEFQ